MKILIRSVRNFFTLCRSHKAFAMLSILSLAAALLCFLVLVEKALYTYEVSHESEFLYTSSEEPEELIDLYQNIMSNENLPDIISISLFDTQYTGIAYDTAQFQWWLGYGRLFSVQEQEQGENVALFSLEYIRQLPKEKRDAIWENGVDINGVHFAGVGAYNDMLRYFSVADLATDYPIPTLVAIPMKAYLACGCQPTMLNAHFSSVLTAEQTNSLCQLLSQYAHLHNTYIPGIRDDLTDSLRETLSTYTAILLMSLIAVVLIIFSWFRYDEKRYNVYMLYGAKKSHIIFFYTMDMLLLCLISNLIAWAGLMFVNLHFADSILAQIPATWGLILGIVAFVFCWIIVIVRVIPMLMKYRKVIGSEAL